MRRSQRTRRGKKSQTEVELEAAEEDVEDQGDEVDSGADVVVVAEEVEEGSKMAMEDLGMDFYGISYLNLDCPPICWIRRLDAELRMGIIEVMRRLEDS